MIGLGTRTVSEASTRHRRALALIGRTAGRRRLVTVTLVALVVCACTPALAGDPGSIGPAVGSRPAALGGVAVATPAATPRPTPTASSGTPASPAPSASPVPSGSPAPSASPVPGGTPVPSASPPPPPVEPLVTRGPAWTTRSLALLAKAGDARRAVAHVGNAFPLGLTGRAGTVQGATWAEVRWKTPSRSGIAWVPLAAVTRADPRRTASASIDALDAALYAYVRSFGTRVGVEVWDRTRGTIYSHNAGRQYLVASSVKVEIMCAFLARVEAEHREPTAQELATLSAMIEWSDNDAAVYFFLYLGDAPALTAYMDRIGVTGFTASPGWRGIGWATITPAAQVRVFDLLRRGKLLTAPHTKLALGLLRNVVPDQRVGVGSTAPAGADVAMKIGWTTGPDDLWVMNSSGIVTYGGVTYVIAVYTDRDATLQEGFAIVEHVAGAISAALLDEP